MTANAQTQPPTSSGSEGTLLSVSAQAEASRVPVVASLSTGVVTQAADANAALAANATQMNKVMAAIKAAGIAEKDIRTSGISVNPQYKYGDNQPPTNTGYPASNTVSIQVREIDKRGEVLAPLAFDSSEERREGKERVRRVKSRRR